MGRLIDLYNRLSKPQRLAALIAVLILLYLCYSGGLASLASSNQPWPTPPPLPTWTPVPPTAVLPLPTSTPIGIPTP